MDLDTLLKQFGKTKTVADKNNAYNKLVDVIYGVGSIVDDGYATNSLIDKLDRVFDEYLVDDVRQDLLAKYGSEQVPIYIVEVGVLMNEDEEEFEDYLINGFYDDKWGFYDENRLAFFDYDEAQKYAFDYVSKGVCGTYGIVHYEYVNIDELSDSQMREIVCSCYMDDMPNPDKDTTTFFMYKTDDGKLDTLINE